MRTWGDSHDVRTCFRVVRERSSLHPKMSRKESEESCNTPSVGPRERDERFSSGSSPAVPPTKSAKQTLEGLSNENDSNVWIVPNKIRRNTVELLEENRTMRRQYEELKESLDFNNAELTSLKKENKELKDKVSSLENSLIEVSADVSDIDICYRMGPRNSSGPKPIIVRFKSHKKKTELYKARKHIKSVILA